MLFPDRTLARVRAFTLIELIVVVFVLGILAAVLSSHLTPIPAARGAALYSTAHKMVDAWTVINDACFTSQTAGGSAIPAPGYTPKDVLAVGAQAVAPGYQRCYATTQLQPMSREIGAAGGKASDVAGYPFDFTGGGGQPFVVTYHNLPHDVAAAIVVRYSQSPVSSLASANSSDARVQYQVQPDGNYQVQILFNGGQMLAAAATNGQPASPSSPSSPSPSSSASPCGAPQGGGNGNQTGNNGNCNGNNNTNSSNTGNNNGNNNPTANNGNGNGNNLPNSSNTGNNNGNGSPCGSGTNTSTAGPVSQTNSNAPTSIQTPINIGGNQQAGMVNNQNCNQANQNAIGNTATANGSGTANAGNTVQQANSSPTSIWQ